MNEQELTAFIRDTVQQVMSEQMLKKEFTPRMLEPTHTKWFRDERGNCSNSKMGIAFHRDGVRTHQIWDRVRPICTAICGKAVIQNEMDKVRERSDTHSNDDGLRTRARAGEGRSKRNHPGAVRQGQ